MATIDRQYPHGMKDNEIENKIKDYSEIIVGSDPNMDTLLQYSPLIQLGQNELQRRQTKYVTRLSIAGSILSIFISVLAVIVAYTSYVSSTRWENNQISLLSKLKLEAKFISAGLEKVVSENTKNIQASKNSSEKLISLIEKLELTADNKPINPAR